jgi:hypothetical protein
MASTDTSTSYKDPSVLALASGVEQKLDLPKGLLVGIVTRGERSNSDQVSEAGARGLGQIIPATRKAAIDKYGIDPYLSDQNSLEVAGHLLKDSLDRNKGDVPTAVAEYHGGTDPANWGAKTAAYVKRVTGALPAVQDTSAAPAAPANTDPAAAPGVAPASGPSTFDQMWAAVNAPPANQIANVLSAYKAGKMAPDEAKQFESDVQGGKIMLPAGQTLQGAAPAPAANGTFPLPPGVVEAYRMGKITGPERDQLLTDVKSGKVAAPDGSQLQLEAAYPNRDYTHIVPGQAGVQKDQQGRPFIDTTPNAPATIGDKLVGAGEAAISAGSGLIAYPAAVTTAGVNLAAHAANALAGGPPLQDDIVANANAMGDALTYHPRTDTGQQYAQNVGDALQPLAGLAPVEAGALHSGVAPVVGAVRQVARAAPGAAIEAAQNLGTAAGGAASTVGDAVGGLIQRARGAAPEAAAEPVPTPGTGGSVGAAGTDMATQRQQAAAALPVPINLTKGQASRTFEQLRFEEETAKDANLGKDLRENSANQNAAIPQNFDRMIDQTGAEAVAPADVGRAVVDNGLVKDAAKAKAEYRAKYKLAEDAGQMQDPVSMQSVIDHLNDSAAEATTAPLLTTARNLAIKLGIARDEGGTLVANTPDAPAPKAADTAQRGSVWGNPKPAEAPPAAGSEVTLATAERFRQAINRNTNIDPTNIRQATILKGLVDQATEGAGGELYAQARKARQRYAQLYEDNAVVSDLLNSRKGTSDRKVALENVFDRTVLNGSREDLSKLRRTLQVSGSEGGAQAWRELQGATLRYLNEESTKGVGTDIHGNPIVSAARLNNAVRALDASGKLDFLLGKRGAAQVRDLNEIVKVIKTSPPGSVNFSNTASVLLGALSDFKTVGGGAAESALMGALTGLPIPVLTGIRTGLRVVKQNAANKETLRRVDEALGRVTAKAKPAAKKAPKQTPMPASKNIH